MDGRMKSRCQAVLPVLTEFLMRSEPLPRRIGAHLDSCPSCTNEALQIRRTAATLQLAAFPDPAPAAAQEAAHPSPDRRSRSIGRILAGAMMVLVMIVVPGALLSGHDRDEAISIQKMGPMVEQPWGTEIEVSLSGLMPGRQYRLMTADAQGHRMPAGSVEVAEHRPVRARLVSAQRRHDITSVLVEGRRGEVIAVLAGPFHS